MERYRIKHIPTGLYYKPGQSSNLTIKGKIYTGKTNILTYYKDVDAIPVQLNEKQFVAFGKGYKQFGYNGNEISSWLPVLIPKTEFEIEPVTSIS